MYQVHSQAAGAYGSAFKASLSPRQLEANVLLKAARQLEDVRQEWTAEKGSDLESALLYNRKLWTFFAAEMAEDANPLPVAIRSNIANLALFVFKRTFELQAAPQPEKIDALIDINKNLASGLLAATESETTVAPGQSTEPQSASASV